MPVFDPIRRCLIVRVVYDGPAFGGKTTNLKQIEAMFPMQRRSEMFTPGALRGRTMFFDWLEIEAGRAGAMQLRCQLLTVPGQGERSYRRRPLLEGADGVVFVADCSPSALAVTRKTFSQLRAQLRKRLPRQVPMLVQANKQDAAGAWGPEVIAAALRLDAHTPVVAATAHLGVGVRETVMAAMRLVVRSAQAMINEQGLSAFVGAVETPHDLFESMLALEDDPPPSMEDGDDVDG